MVIVGLRDGTYRSSMIPGAISEDMRALLVVLMVSVTALLSLTYFLVTALDSIGGIPFLSWKQVFMIDVMVFGLAIIFRHNEETLLDEDMNSLSGRLPSK